MNWRDIISVRISDDWALDVLVGPVLIVLVVAAAVWVFVRVILGNRNRFEVVEIEAPIVGGSITLHRNDEVVRVAHAAWTEIITRKAGLEFDEENDLIDEVYNSWYELFKELRALTKTVPAHMLRTSKDARELVNLLVKVLNEGLRPHLTKHHARFRNWKKRADEDADERDDQDRQRDFPGYEALVADLKYVNAEMVQFANQLKVLAQGKSEGA